MHSTPQSETVAPPTPASIDDLGGALGRVPSGLFIITWRAGDTDRSMLASWVMQAGFDPPMLTVAVAPGRDLLAAIEAGAVFVVNVLGEQQRSLLARFGKPTAPGEDPFAGLAVRRAPCGAAVLGDAAAWLECTAVGRLCADAPDRGDHVVVLGRVAAGGPGSDLPPLVHVRRNGLRY